MSSYSSFDSRKSNTMVEGNPNPLNYKIVKYHQHQNNLMIWLVYPDCNNYEGNKILIFKNTDLQDLTKQKKIDPHFSDNKKYKSPFMRLEPTDEGWNIGKQVLEMFV